MQQNKPELDPLEESRMTLGEHLDELRRRLISSVAALFVVFIACWFFRDPISHIVLKPGERAVGWIEEARVELYEAKLVEAAAEADEKRAEGREVEFDPAAARMEYFLTGDPEDQRLAKPTTWPPFADGASGGFFFLVKCCFYFSLFIGGPYMLYQMWLFIAAGLYKSEKRAVYSYLPFSVGLFLFGVVFGYFMTVPYGYYFVASMALETVTLLPKIEVYFTFLSSLSLAMGIVFQLPVLMIGLARLELIDPDSYGKYRGHFVISALVIAALLTPPDPYTQVMMAGPMVILYEIGVHLSRLLVRRAKTTASVVPS